jgi:hypothetical protein
VSQEGIAKRVILNIPYDWLPAYRKAKLLMEVEGDGCFLRRILASHIINHGLNKGSGWTEETLKRRIRRAK